MTENRLQPHFGYLDIKRLRDIQARHKESMLGSHREEGKNDAYFIALLLMGLISYGVVSYEA